METITLRINKRSKAGKALEAVLQIFATQPGVEIVEEKSHYNPEFVEKIKRSQKEIREGKYVTLNSENV